MDKRWVTRAVMTMTVLEELVGTYGLTVDQFTDQLRQELAAQRQSDPRALTQNERAVLSSIGVAEADLTAPAPSSSLIPTAATVLRDIDGMLTTSQMAETLRRSESRVRGAIADGSLFGVRIGRSWRLPAWQIADGHPLPHLRKLIAAIPDGVSAAVLGRVMTQPTDELVLDGSATSPRHWLLTGGDPASIVAAINSLLAW